MRNIFIITLFALIGCASQMNNPDDIDTETEGLVLTDIECPSIISGIQLYRSGRKVNYFSPDFQIWCGKGLGSNRNGVMLMKLSEGDYYIGSLGKEGNLHYREKDAYKFTVKKDSINYIGKIQINHLEATETDKVITHHIDFNISNDFESSVGAILEVYPDILNRFTVSSSIVKK